MGGRELTKNLVACIDQSGSEKKKKGRKGVSQPGDGEHEGQETTSRGWREGYKSTVEEVSGTEGHADKGVL